MDRNNSKEKHIIKQKTQAKKYPASLFQVISVQTGHKSDHSSTFLRFLMRSLFVILHYTYLSLGGGFPSAQTVKESACNVCDPGSIPGSGRSPGEGNGNPLQYSCVENSMERRAWQATVNEVAKSQTLLSD